MTKTEARQLIKNYEHTLSKIDECKTVLEALRKMNYRLFCENEELKKENKELKDLVIKELYKKYE